MLIAHCSRDRSVTLTNYLIFTFSHFLVSRFRACLQTQSGRVPSLIVLSHDTLLTAEIVQSN